MLENKLPYLLFYNQSRQVGRGVALVESIYIGCYQRATHLCSISCLKLIFFTVVGLEEPLSSFLEGTQYTFSKWMNEWMNEWMTGGSRVRIPLLPPRRGLGQALHLQLPTALRRVNSDTVSIAVVGRASGSAFWNAVRRAIQIDKYNTLQ